MMPEATAHHTFTTPTRRRGRLSDRLVGAASLLTALVLVLALTGPGTFILAKKAADATSGAQSPVRFIPPEEATSTAGTGPATDRIGTGEDRDKEPSPGPKRPKGVVLKTEVNKVFALVVPPESLGLRIEEGGYKNEPVFIEVPARDDTIPQELLRRPPPGK